MTDTTASCLLSDDRYNTHKPGVQRGTHRGHSGYTGVHSTTEDVAEWGSVVGGGGGVVDEVGGILYAPAAVAECTPYTPCALCGEMHPVYPLCPLWWNAPRIPPTSAVVECTPYISYILRSRSERVMSVSFPRYPLSVTWAMCDVGELWGLCGY